MSSLQMQQELFKQWAQMWPASPANFAAFSGDWPQKLQKRWFEFTIESLNRQRELIDSTYKSIIQLVEQAAHLTESKTPDDYRRTSDELRHKMVETFKVQSDAQFREFEKTAQNWFDMVPNA